MLSIDEIRRNAYSRRKFMASMTVAGLGLAASRLLDGASPFSPRASFAAQAPGVSTPAFSSTDFPGIPGNDINQVVLNFALTLEILEADLYRQALNLASGLPLSTVLKGGPGEYALAVGAGGLSAGDAAAAYVYLQRFTFVEAAHRDFLLAAITAQGGTPVTANPAGYQFPTVPAADLMSILSAILPLEETGVRAYLGAAVFLTDLDIATIATGIYSTEARHSAAIADTIGRDPGPVRLSGDLSVVPNTPNDNTFEFFLAPSTVLTAAQAYFA